MADFNKLYQAINAPLPEYLTNLQNAINRFGYPIYAVNTIETRYYRNIALARKYESELMKRKKIFFVSEYPTLETKPKQVEFYAPGGIYNPQTKGTWLDDDGG